MSNEIVRQVPARLQQGDTAWVLQQYESGNLVEMQANLPAQEWEAFGIALRNGDAAGAQAAVTRYPYFDKPAKSRSSVWWVVLAVVVLAAVIAGIVIWLAADDDDEEVVATTTTAAPTTTVAITTTTAVALPTIERVLLNDPRFSVLYGYAVAGGLQGAIRGDAPITLFAPTNAAFAAAEAEAGDLLEQITSDPANLQQILSYHAIGEDLPNVPTGDVASIEGSDLALDGSVTPPTVNGNPITETITASNGTIYVIDAVLIPADFVPPTTTTAATTTSTSTTVPLQSIPPTLVDRGNFTALTTLIASSGLDPVLSAAGPFTLWAPNDAAFAALSQAQRDALADPELLRRVLEYHVTPGRLLVADLASQAYPTVEGQNVNVVVGDPVTVETVPIVVADILASNGVIHEIPSVLIPPDVDFPG